MSAIQFLWCLSLENLELDQPILPKLISFFILISCLLDIILKVWGEILSRSLVGLFRIKIGDFIILQWLKYSYAFKCNKKSDENVMLWNTYNGKTCCWWLMSSMFQFSWEMLFFESGDTRVFKDDRNKLFASNEKQIDNHT